MNKRRVDEMIPKAFDVLKQVGIVKGDVINSAWRGQISSFGASMVQGSLLAAVSFFSAKGKQEEGRTLVDRSLLVKAIERMLDLNESLFEYVKAKMASGDEMRAKETIVNAAVALKLAMNLYERERS